MTLFVLIRSLNKSVTLYCNNNKANKKLKKILSPHFATCQEVKDKKKITIQQF